MEPLVNSVTAHGKFDYGGDLNLPYIASKVQSATFNKKRFPGVILRKKNPRGTVILFRSGKFMILGCQTIQEVQILSRKLLKDLRKVLNDNIWLPQQCRIANISATASLGYRVKLQEVAELPNAIKDDKCPSVILRMTEIKTALIYRSGRLSLSGTTQNKALFDAYETLKKEMIKFKEQEPILKAYQDNETEN